ncbi:MAG TPA: HAD-IA family hydrolase [Acetobacteraceae bacterium]|nr:HAD-IA family hydrolase [Acetobacteraceae bacterium]
MSPLRLVIFDCDGVLIDSEPVCNRVVAGVLTGLGWRITAQECERRFTGMSFYAMRALVEERIGHALPLAWEAELAAVVAERMEREAVAFPYAEQAIQAVADSGLAWRVASNSSHREMAAKFARTGLDGLLAGRLHSVEDVIEAGGRGKPAPDLFLSAARAERVGPDACLVVEDSPLGVRAAVAAGMTCWGFCPNGAAPSLLAEGAVPFRSLAEFPALLRAEIARRSAP